MVFLGEANTGSKEDVFIREHRLYQADFLLRMYGFTEQDISYDKQGHLFWTGIQSGSGLTASGVFPVHINRADKHALLKVPGVGPETATKIVKIRKSGPIRRIDDLPIKGKRSELVRKYVVCG